jgi:protein TonB
VTRGFLVSAALHASIMLFIIVSPRPPAFDWDTADAIAVELVPLSEAPPGPPVEIPAPEVAVEPEPLVPEVSADPEPPPVEPVRAKPRPQRIIRPIAPRREPEDTPSLSERIERRLAEAAHPVEETPDPERTAPPAATSTAEVHAVDFPFAWYLQVVRTKITDVWDPPGDRMVAGRRKQAVLRFVIHRDGRVTDVRVEDGSGTPGLDASARRAVEQARPFPPLPDTYEGDSLDVAVRFTVEGGA